MVNILVSFLFSFNQAQQKHHQLFCYFFFRILTGCYDSTIHIWTTKGKRKLTIPGHTAAIKSVAWISLDAETGSFVR